LHPFQAGEVQLFGRDVRGISPGQRARLVAVVPQEVTTPMAFTVDELVALGRTVPRNRWVGLDETDRREIDRALAYTDTLELRERLYTELSGGEKQRVIIAMALAQEPKLLLLDEPTAHLDINHRLEILQLLERLNRERGLTVLMTSHDLNLASEFFPQLVVMDRGRIAATGTPAETLREDLLEEVYHCKLSVRTSETGVVNVSPTRWLPPAMDAKRGRVHVIGGGGAGVEVMRRLCLAGWQVTGGVLNQGDTDALAAVALGLAVALEKPFSLVGEAALAQARELAASAETVVICEVPFGPGNVRNLEIARLALSGGKRVLLNIRHLETRDFTANHEAQTALRSLREQGAVTWEHVDDLLVQLQGTGKPR
jgi:iron complex transport system ATP-binding protein